MSDLVERLTRPIINVELRTPQEVFDMMSDRIRYALASAPPQEGVRETDVDAFIDQEWGALFGDGPDSFANPGSIHYDEFRSAMRALSASLRGEGAAS